MTYGYVSRKSARLPLSTRQEREAEAEQTRLVEQIALADPYPETVTYGHFIRRDLAAAVEGGRCTVTMPHPLFGSSLPGIPVVDVAFTEDYRGFMLTISDGSEFTRFGKGVLAVTWHDFGDTWEKLSAPMRLALHRLDSGAGKKPRKNTLKALELRGLIANGLLTSTGLALYRQHKQEFGHGAN